VVDSFWLNAPGGSLQGQMSVPSVPRGLGWVHDNHSLPLL
jgi:hypothetical protein